MVRDLMNQNYENRFKKHYVIYQVQLEKYVIFDIEANDS